MKNEASIIEEHQRSQARADASHRKEFEHEAKIARLADWL